MASASARLITRSWTLSSGTTRFPSRQLVHKHAAVGPAYAKPSKFSSQQMPLQSRAAVIKSYYSTFSNPCTTSRKDQFSQHSIQWSAQRQTVPSRHVPIISRSIFQRRSASHQPGTDAKDEATPSTTLPITAPTILQKALNPTKHENIYTVPNILTFSRLLCAPAIGYFILHSEPVIALSLFVYAGLTDLIDGYIARRYNSQTVVGTIIDPMADKTLMTITVVCLAVQGFLPVWLAVIILGRDVGLAISATYYRYISLPPPKTFRRYWDFSLPSAEVRPTEISKINTMLQLLLVGNAMVLPVLPAVWVEAWNLVGVFEGWQFLVAGTTIWSGLSYVFSNDAVKILSQEEKSSESKEEEKKL